MNILVTGGLGFIGSHLVSELIKNHHRVTVLDIQKPQNNNVEWIKSNILDLETFKKNLKNVDIVYHFAAIADASLSERNPLQTIKVNVEGTANILEACRINNIKRFIYASSIWVYSASKEYNVDENTLLSTNTKHIYTSSKLIGESLCYNYHDLYGLNFTILRLSVPYGINGTFNVIPIFIKKTLNNEPLIVRGTGEQKRQYIYIDDLCSGCVTVLRNIARNQIYNLAGEELTSINDIVEIIKKQIPNVNVKRVPIRLGEIDNKKISIQKIKGLGWKEKTKLEEGIIKTIEQWKTKENVK